MDILVLVLGLVFLTFLAMKGVPIIVGALVTSVLISLILREDVQKMMMESYMGGFSDYILKFFIIFLLGGIFGKLSEISGATETIATGIVNRFGEGAVITGIILATGILGFGGVSLFVALFAIYPLAVSLFRKADLPMNLFPGAYIAGCGTFAMTAPFSPSVQNIIPSKYLGTPLGALPVQGTIASVFVAVVVILYMNSVAKKAKARGEHFVEPNALFDPEAEDEKNRPGMILALIPMIALVTLMNAFGLSVELALLLGLIIEFICYVKYLPMESAQVFWGHIIAGINNAVSAIVNTSATVGLGSVIASTAAFGKLIDYFSTGTGNPYIISGIAVTVLAGVAGSASGGLGIAVPIVAKVFVPMGVDPAALHRIAAIGSGGLDSLPHNGFVNTVLNVSKQSHKDAYFHIFMTSIVFPLIELVLLYVLLAITGVM